MSVAGPSLHGSQIQYFRHDLMRFFAEAVLHHSYVELHPPVPEGLSPFCFDSATRAICRPSDLLTPLALRDFPSPAAEARHLAVSYLRRRVRRRPHPPESHPLFRIPGLGTCGLVVHARDNALVVVQRRPRSVWKLVQDASRNAILESERMGARVAPSLAPAVLDWKPPGDTTPGYVRLDYALDTEPLTAADLSAVLRHITPALMSAYRASGVSGVEPGTVVDELHRCTCALEARTPSPFTVASLEVLRTIRGVLERQASAGTAALYRAFAHGDIQLSNLRRTGRRIALIDWGNGGRHNVLLDAFIVELFAPTPDVWRDVLTRGTLETGRGFRGWLPAYLDGLATTVDVGLSPANVALGLVCSMAEKTIAIVTRHAGTDEQRGLHSLERIQRLLSSAG